VVSEGVTCPDLDVTPICDEPDSWRSNWGEWVAPTLDRLTGPAEAWLTADVTSGAAAAGAALNPASTRLAAAQRMDIDQRRDGAGIGELSFDGWGRPESKGIVRLPRARREMLPINTGCPGNGARNRQQSFL